MASNSLSLELILIENVLKISLSKDPLKSSSGFRYDLTQLPQISRELLKFPHTHLIDDPTFIDNILIERFSIPQTEILSYSAESYALSRSEAQKAINVSNQRAQKFLSYLQEILVSYAALAILEPMMFPLQHPPSILTGIELSSFRVMEFLQRGGSKDFLMLIVGYWNRESSGFCEEFFDCLNAQIKFKVKNMNLLDDPGAVAGVFKDLLEIKGISNKKIQESLYQDH